MAVLLIVDGRGDDERGRLGLGSVLFFVLVMRVYEIGACGCARIERAHNLSRCGASRIFVERVQRRGIHLLQRGPAISSAELRRRDARRVFYPWDQT